MHQLQIQKAMIVIRIRRVALLIMLLCVFLTCKSHKYVQSDDKAYDVIIETLRLHYSENINTLRDRNSIAIDTLFSSISYPYKAPNGQFEVLTDYFDNSRVVERRCGERIKEFFKIKEHKEFYRFQLVNSTDKLNFTKIDGLEYKLTKETVSQNHIRPDLRTYLKISYPIFSRDDTHAFIYVVSSEIGGGNGWIFQKIDGKWNRLCILLITTIN